MAVKGTFKDISFTELLQLMHMSQKTGRMEVTIDRRWAMVIFREGVVWHVEPRGFRGASPEEVLFDIMASVDGGFVFQRLQVLPSLERTVAMATETLIMEGVKRMDDAAVAADKLGDTKQLEQIPKFKPGAEAKVRYVPQKTKQVLQVIDGHRTLKQVIQHSQMDAEEVSAIIQELVTKDVLDLVEVEADMVAAAQADMPAAPPPPLPAAPPTPPAPAPPPAPVAPPPPVEQPVLTITPSAPAPPAPAPTPAPAPAPAAARGPVLRVKPGSESSLRFMPQKAKRLLQALDGQRGVDEAIELSGVDREEALKIISDLTAQGILEQA